MTWPRATSVPRTFSDVLVGREADLVVDADRRDDHAELGGDLAADGATRCSSEPPADASTSGDQAEADRELERVERQRLARPGRAASRRGAGSAACRASAIACSAASAGVVGLASVRPTRKNSAPMTRNGIFGRPGTSANAQMTAPATIGALRCARIWPAMSVPRSSSEARARDDDAGRDRDQQRRDLRGEAVADRSAARSAGRPRRTACPAAATPMTMPPMRLIERDDHRRRSRRP